MSKSSAYQRVSVATANACRKKSKSLDLLRHRFAVQTLLRWYRAGEDIDRRLPVLSTYLGHVHVSDTYWYLSSWPELMQEAMNRLESRWEVRA